MNHIKMNAIAEEIETLERKLQCAIGHAILCAIAEAKLDPDNEADCLRMYYNFKAVREMIANIKESL